MATEWGFLEPWFAVLRACLVERKTNADEPHLRFVIYRFSNRNGLAYDTFTIRVRPDASLVRQLVEAVGLFTLLSFVNNRAFVDVLMERTGIRVAALDGHFYCPRWDLELPVVGILSPSPAVPHSPVTWASLLGFPSEYSQNFEAAAQKLLALQPQESIEVRFRAYTHWSYRAHGVRVGGRQGSGECAGDMSVVLTEFQKLLDLHAPADIQLRLACQKDTLLNVWRQTPVPESSRCEYVSAKIYSLSASRGFSRLVRALTRMPISRLQLYLDCGDWVAGPSQDVISALSTLICGRSFCTLPTVDRGNSKATPRADCGRMDLSCHSVSDDVFVTAFSAVAGICSKTQLRDVDVHSMNPTRWAWLMYALYCRASDVRNPDNAVGTLTIGETTLTKADMSAIAAVLETGYPLSSSREAREHGLVYGFVDIDEGAQLWPSVSLADNNSGMIGSCKFRCRASYDVTEGGLVHIVVPGYGVCTTEIGDSIPFTADSDKPYVIKNRICDKLKFYFDSIQDVGVVVDLLKLLFRNIHSLSIHVHDGNQRQPILDLSVVATACPLLEGLSTNNCTIVVSSHDEALHTWPIREMLIQQTDTVSGLIACLRNPALRVARELVELVVSPTRNQEFDEEERRELDALDEEVLPITEEKLPKLAKAAMISVVTRSCTASRATVESKAIFHMDANILSLIFVFASTPAQRNVWSL